MQAIWASMALPGLFPPIEDGGRWLIDGGLVNPVPVSLCRVLGADLVIAVNLNGDVIGRVYARQEVARLQAEAGTGFMQKLRNYSASLFPSKNSKNITPSLYEAIAGSMSIAQDRITRSRMAGDPPDILLTPRLGSMGFLEFHRAADAIQEGGDCVRRMHEEIRHVMD
jgi:NTE family protein